MVRPERAQITNIPYYSNNTIIFTLQVCLMAVWQFPVLHPPLPPPVPGPPTRDVTSTTLWTVAWVEWVSHWVPWLCLEAARVPPHRRRHTSTTLWTGSWDVLGYRWGPWKSVRQPVKSGKPSKTSNSIMWVQIISGTEFLKQELRMTSIIVLQNWRIHF